MHLLIAQCSPYHIAVQFVLFFTGARAGIVRACLREGRGLQSSVVASRNRSL